MTQADKKESVKETVEVKPAKRGNKLLWLVLTALSILLAILVTPILTAKTVIGNKIDIADCQVKKRDPKTGELYSTGETVEIHQVDYGVKLVQAKTMEGGVYGLGFIHAQDRLWQM